MNQSADKPEVSLAAIKYLVLEGGGVKGIGYVGAIKKLEQLGVMDNIEHVAGSSAGGITALLVGLGEPSNGIESIMEQLDFTSFQDRKNPFWTQVAELAHIQKGIRIVGSAIEAVPVVGHVASGVRQVANKVGQGVTAAEDMATVVLSNRPGLYKGQAFHDWAKQIIAKKLGNPNATFADLERLRELNPELKAMTFTGTNISTGELMYFDAENTPNMRIADAVRITMSFPGAFEPYQVKFYKGQVIYDEELEYLPVDELVNVQVFDFADGGIMNNCPMEYFDQNKFIPPGSRASSTTGQLVNPHTLGIKVDSQSEIDRTAQEMPGFKAWASQLGAAALSDANKLDTYKGNIVQINDQDISTLDFELNATKQQALVNAGRSAIEMWARGKQNRILEERLSYYLSHNSQDELFILYVHFQGELARLNNLPGLKTRKTQDRLAELDDKCREIELMCPDFEFKYRALEFSSPGFQLLDSKVRMPLISSLDTVFLEQGLDDLLAHEPKEDVHYEQLAVILWHVREEYDNLKQNVPNYQMSVRYREIATIIHKIESTVPNLMKCPTVPGTIQRLEENKAYQSYLSNLYHADDDDYSSRNKALLDALEHKIAKFQEANDAQAEFVNELKLQKDCVEFAQSEMLSILDDDDDIKAAFFDMLKDFSNCQEDFMADQQAKAEAYLEGNQLNEVPFVQRDMDRYKIARESASAFYDMLYEKHGQVGEYEVQLFSQYVVNDQFSLISHQSPPKVITNEDALMKVFDKMTTEYKRKIRKAEENVRQTNDEIVEYTKQRELLKRKHLVLETYKDLHDVEGEYKQKVNAAEKYLYIRLLDLNKSISNSIKSKFKFMRALSDFKHKYLSKVTTVIDLPGKYLIRKPIGKLLRWLLGVPKYKDVVKQRNFYQKLHAFRVDYEKHFSVMDKEYHGEAHRLAKSLKTSQPMDQMKGVFTGHFYDEVERRNRQKIRTLSSHQKKEHMEKVVCPDIQAFQGLYQKAKRRCADEVSDKTFASFSGYAPPVA